MNEQMVPEPVESGAGGGWLRFLRRATITTIVVIVLINIFAGPIPPLLVFAVLFLIGLFWLSKATKGPAILLLVALVLYLALSAPFVIPTMTVPASAGDFILNLASLLAGIGAVVAAIFVIRGRVEPSDSPRTLGRVLIGVFVVGTIVSIFSLVTYEDATLQEGDVELVTRDLEFDETSLEADSGTVSVFVKNEDSTLHTFTIEELDVDLDIPASKSARVTFEAEPGTYEFICVPHQEDMKGTIEIR